MAKQFELNDASSSQFELFDASSSPNQDNMPQEITKVKPVVKKETESKYQLLLSVFNISIFILGALTISWGFPASHSLFLIRAMQISTFMINSPSPTSAPFIDGSLDCEFYKQTTKHVPSCDFVPDDPSEKLVIPLLISATPRSGTHHTKTVLQSLGLDVSDDGHFPGKIGTVSWVLAFRDNIRYQTDWLDETKTEIDIYFMEYIEGEAPEMKVFLKNGTPKIDFGNMTEGMFWELRHFLHYHYVDSVHTYCGPNFLIKEKYIYVIDTEKRNVQMDTQDLKLFILEKQNFINLYLHRWKKLHIII